MAIQPIDLQTLFVRLSQVGREQSALKQAIAQNQAVTGNEIAQQSRDAGNTVRQADEVSEGPETVDEEGNPTQQQASDQREDREETESVDAHDEDVFRDPDLGQNIDLTG